MCCNGDCSTELYLAPFVIFQFDFLSPHFFFLNNSTPTVRMYCTVLYFTERTYFDLSSHQFDSYSTVRTYLRTYVFGAFRHVSIQFLRYVRTYRISYCTEARKFLIFETFKNHFIDTVPYLTSSYKTAHH